MCYNKELKIYKGNLMKKLVALLSLAFVLNASPLSAANTITLDEAIKILKSQNLEIKAASLDVESANQEAKTVSGNHWGKLDFVQDFANSNDAGNVFGFKLTSREATFGDFGAREFMNATGMNGGVPPDSAYTTPPEELNNPEARNFFQSKLKYEVPLFTGFQLSGYEDIMNSMAKMKSLEKDQVINEKIYQVRKSFYDMALIENSKNNLTTIYKNIEKLEDMTRTMLEVGYAKRVDLLEVQSKKGNVKRLLNQMESNQELLYHILAFY